METRIYHVDAKPQIIFPNIEERLKEYSDTYVDTPASVVEDGCTCLIHRGVKHHVYAHLTVCEEGEGSRMTVSFEKKPSDRSLSAYLAALFTTTACLAVMIWAIVFGAARLLGNDTPWLTLIAPVICVGYVAYRRRPRTKAAYRRFTAFLAGLPGVSEMTQQ